MTTKTFSFSLLAALNFAVGGAWAQVEYNDNGYSGSGITYEAPDYGNNNNNSSNSNEPVYRNVPNTGLIQEQVPIYVQPGYPSYYPYYNQPYPYARPPGSEPRDNSRRIGGPLNPTRSNPTFAPNAQPDSSNSNNRSFQDRPQRGPNFNERRDRRLN